MFVPWIKRLGALSLVMMLVSESLAQYGAMPYYGADAGVTYGTPVGQWTGGQAGYTQWQARHLQNNVPRSPGAGIPLLNGGGRFWGIGYSEGYHQCSSCGSGDCGRYGACNFNTSSIFSAGFTRGQTRQPSPNIVVAGTPACQSCATTIQNTPCGNQHFGNYNLHPGHVFGKPSYGNPLFAPDCINWRQAVKYDQGPCIPNSVYANHPLMPPAAHSGGYLGGTNGPPPTGPVPNGPSLSNSQPVLPHSLGISHNPPQPTGPQPLTDSSPSDLKPGAWPWQRAQGNTQQVPRSLPRNLQEPTPAKPQQQTFGRQIQAVPPAVSATIPKPTAPIETDSGLLDTDPAESEGQPSDSEQHLDVKQPIQPQGSEPTPATPQVPSLPATPAPKTESAPAADDEDLLSNRRNPIRQPARR